MSQQEIRSYYIHMTIGEARSDKQVEELRRIFDRHSDRLRHEAGFTGSACLSESSGNLMIFETRWTTAAEAIQYGSSRSYRSLIVATQHLLVGDPVVKLFHCSAVGGLQ